MPNKGATAGLSMASKAKKAKKPTKNVGKKKTTKKPVKAKTVKTTKKKTSAKKKRGVVAEVAASIGSLVKPLLPSS